MIYIETDRLLLRDWEKKDLPVFRQMNADEVVMKYFPKPLTVAETDTFYETIQKEFQEMGYGLYAVEVKESGDFIGFIGFHKATFAADFTPCIEIGWRLDKASWGRGYATEGATACLAYGLDILGLQDIYSFTATINKPSIRVIEKIGMTFKDRFDHPKVEMDSPLKLHVLYHVEKGG